MTSSSKTAAEPSASSAVSGPVDVATEIQDEKAIERSRELSRQQQQQPPAQVAGYTILRCLGEGAYGSVWLAREENTGKLVSIKFYTHRRGLDWPLLNREVEKLAVLYTSRNIVGLIDVGWESDPPYYVMEYLENGSLAAALAEGPLSVPEAVRIAKAVLQALVHAHGSGILHCDLKPANVLLGADREPRLCDFGQSRLSHEQDPALGTLFYMAPEQADLKAVPDARWDVYSLGALLYQLLCGEPPYQTADNERLIRSADALEERLAIYRRIVRQCPKPHAHRRLHGVDKRLADIVDRCLHVNPQRRFPNAQAVLDALIQRDRQRSRRPLIALGVVGPALLLLALVPIARSAMGRAVDAARINLTERALESDAHSVKILASSLERDLEDRQAELEEFAQQPELRQALEQAAQSQWTDREALHDILGGWYHSVTDKRVELGRKPDNSWFLLDGEGYQRWRHKLTATIDENWSHRDYFHGRNVNYPHGEEPGGIRPLTRPHISLAYRGTSELKFKVAISVPIWDVDGENVIGVLARTSELGDLLAEYEDRIHGEGPTEVNRLIALVDGRDGNVLDHPWIRESRQADEPDNIETFQKLKIAPELQERLEEMRAHVDETSNVAADVRVDEYVDPVSQIDPAGYGPTWLAAFAPVQRTRWVAVVQEPKTAALQPVEKLRDDMSVYFWLGFLTSLGLLAAVWFFVLTALNDRGLHFWTKRERGRTTGGITTVRDS